MIKTSIDAENCYNYLLVTKVRYSILNLEVFNHKMTVMTSFLQLLEFTSLFSALQLHIVHTQSTMVPCFLEVHGVPEVTTTVNTKPLYSTRSLVLHIPCFCKGFPRLCPLTLILPLPLLLDCNKRRRMRWAAHVKWMLPPVATCWWRSPQTPHQHVQKCPLPFDSCNPKHRNCQLYCVLEPCLLTCIKTDSSETGGTVSCSWSFLSPPSVNAPQIASNWIG